MTSAATSIVVGINEPSQYRWLWFGGAAALLAVVPWTFIVMMPDIKRLLEDDVIEKEGNGCLFLFSRMRLMFDKNGQ